MAQLVNKAKNFVADKLASVKKPEAEVSDVSFKGVSRQFATFHSTVAIANPYDHDIPIGKISYSLRSAKRWSSTLSPFFSLSGPSSCRGALEIPNSYCYLCFYSVV